MSIQRADCTPTQELTQTEPEPAHGHGIALCNEEGDAIDGAVVTRDRPKGSKNKPKAGTAAIAAKKRGKPKDSKNKPQPGHASASSKRRPSKRMQRLYLDSAPARASPDAADSSDSAESSGVTDHDNDEDMSISDGSSYQSDAEDLDAEDDVDNNDNAIDQQPSYNSDGLEGCDDGVMN